MKTTKAKETSRFSIVTLSVSGQVILPAKMRKFAKIEIGERLLVSMNKDKQIIFQKVAI